MFYNFLWFWLPRNRLLLKLNSKVAEAEADRLAIAIKRDWREREKLQEVPARPRNYYSYVCDSKEVLKVMNQFTNGLTTIKTVSFMKFYE